jgi:hypothetical protein
MQGGRAQWQFGQTFAADQLARALQDYNAKLHYDGNTVGSNSVIDLGPFKGVYGKGILNVQNNMQEICGVVPHMSMKFTEGPRWTLVYFVPRNYEKCLAKLEISAQLVNLGFQLPNADTNPRFLAILEDSAV